jgi:hypothetical protein
MNHAGSLADEYFPTNRYFRKNSRDFQHKQTRVEVVALVLFFAQFKFVQFAERVFGLERIAGMSDVEYG